MTSVCGKQTGYNPGGSLSRTLYVSILSGIINKTISHAYSTMYSQVVTHPSTNTVEPCLTAVVLLIESKRFRPFLPERTDSCFELHWNRWSNTTCRNAPGLSDRLEKLLSFFFSAENTRDRIKWKRYCIANRDSLWKIIIAISVRKNIHITRMRVYWMPTWMKILIISQWYISCSFQNWNVSKVGNLA